MYEQHSLIQLRPRSGTEYISQGRNIMISDPEGWIGDHPHQSLLGIFAYAPLNVLFVDPHLPTWLPEITLERLRVGEATVSFSFKRTEKGETDYRITDQHGTLHVIRQPSPWSLTAGFGERMKDVIMSLLPGR